jgi:cell division protease FtsH
VANFDWIGALINWAPMVLLIGVWIFFLRRMGYGGGKFRTGFQKEYLDELRKQNAALERIAAVLEKQKS